uniref:Uncharacterized protein n=1 Tax=Helianthus annuus TaxID=4232 RepID=A0A251SYW7_HELAN
MITTTPPPIATVTATTPSPTSTTTVTPFLPHGHRPQITNEPLPKISQSHFKVDTYIWKRN